MAYVTWNSKFGTTTQTTDVLITGSDEVEITGNITVRNIDITEGGKLRLAPGANITLNCYGNIHVQNTDSIFISRPNVGVNHTVIFQNVNEEAFVGTANDMDHSFQPTDRGLWIQHGARIDIGDARDRLPWTNLAGSANAGDTTITLKESPTNWQIGDRLVITPTVSPQTHPNNYWSAYDEPTITGINGNTVSLSAPLAFPHPEVTSDPRVTPNGWTQPTSWTAEVLNLTRDVKIQGTPTGRAHIMIHSNGLMHIKNVEIRYMGPQKKVKSDGSVMSGVEGRYALHFHHGDYNVGWPEVKSTYENITVSQSGFRSFVTHNSHGITLTRCIGHDGQGPMFWWDPNGMAGQNFQHNQTFDLTWDRCVGSKVRPMTGMREHRLEIFAHPDGVNMKTLDCVAVGEASIGSSSGFSWGEGANDVWVHERNLAHNCKTNGIFTWQNNNEPHHVDDFTAYHCLRGVDHGAYKNGYQYRRVLTVGCVETGLLLHASSSMTVQMFLDFGIDGKGFGQHAMIFAHPNLSASIESRLNDWKIANLAPPNPTTGVGHGIKIYTGIGKNPNIAYIRDWQFVDPDFTLDHLIWWDSNYIPGDVLKVRHPVIGGEDQGMFDVYHPEDPRGTSVAAWNNAKKMILETDDLGAEFDGSYPVYTEMFTENQASGWGPAWVSSFVGSGSTAYVENGVGVTTNGGSLGAGVHLYPSDLNLLDPTIDSQITATIDFNPMKGTDGLYYSSIGLRASRNQSTSAITGYWLKYRSKSDWYGVYKYDANGNETLLGQFANPTGSDVLIDGGIHEAKLRIETPVDENGQPLPTRLRARTWLQGTPEPSMWGYDAEITGPIITTGQPGVSYTRASGYSGRVDWRKVTISNFIVPPNENALMLTAEPGDLVFSDGVTTLPLAIGTTDNDQVEVEVIAVPDWVTLSQPTSFTAPQSINVTINTATLPAEGATGQLFFASQTHGELQVVISYTGGAAAVNKSNWWVKTDSGLVQATVHIKI